MTDNNKHLVRVGHEFAAAMSDDTPIITIAKMVTELASALDVQSARSDALATENANIKNFRSVLEEIKSSLVGGGHGHMAAIDMQAQNAVLDVVFDAFDDIKTPATAAWVNEQRAVGVDDAIDVILTVMDRTAPAHHAISMLRAHATRLRGSQV